MLALLTLALWNSTNCSSKQKSILADRRHLMRGEAPSSTISFVRVDYRSVSTLKRFGRFDTAGGPANICAICLIRYTAAVRTLLRYKN